MEIPVLIAFGANLGNREQTISQAVELLLKTGAVREISLSKLYETEPVGFKDQPFFINAALKGTTQLSPEILLKTCRDIETQLGRTPRAKWHEREIDIDILLYGKEILLKEDVEIPHPRMQERRFVLLPASDVASEMIHPVFKKSVAELLKECEDMSLVSAVS
ncbi:MAG: 2-amino-4-hydroxy-6-hydroxymethyldihydropteridine diphosphokinase [Bacteroidota bacterium]